MARAPSEAVELADDLPPAEELRDAAARTRALVVGPYRTRDAARGGADARSPAARLDEATGLAAAIDLDVADAVIAPLSAPRPATLLGKGKVEEFAQRIKADRIGLVVMDGALSPIQQRNLEKAFGCKVIDRTGLILEIFGRRARTKEGALQVELAHLNYQKSRLVRSWTHLERQRGGFGFLGGPGETQIETDRRLITERIARIERDLEKVTRTRALHRKSRDKVPYPSVALVGYTNAGKSTLFNRLTRADVLAEDMLFATLDPTARAVKLPHGATVILSDTVGFVSDLPTMLVAAFRATLEDVVSSDVILHVRDVSHEDTDAQAADVRAILDDLGVGPDTGTRVVEVWNKADRLGPDERARLSAVADARPVSDRPHLVSALDGSGVEALVAAIERRVAEGAEVYVITLAPDEGAAAHWLHENAEVLERRPDADGRLVMVVRVPPARSGPLRQRFPSARQRS